MEEPGAADLHRRARAAAIAPTPSTPPTARSSTRSRGSRSARASPSPTSRARSTSSPGRSSAPSARPASGPASSRSPSRASRSTSPASAAAAPASCADGSRDPLCKGVGWIEILGSGMVDPNVFGFVREQRLRPRAGPGLRVRDGDRADRDAQARRPRPAQVLRERRPRAGAVPMKVPYSLADASTAIPGLAAEELGERARDAHDRGRADLAPRGAERPRASWSAACCRAEQHPNADRLRVCEVDTGDGTRTIVCGAPNVAAGQTVAVALPGARDARTATKLGKAKLRGVESDGMILSEPSSRSARTTTGSWSSTPTGRRRARRWPRCSPVAEPVLELEPTSNRVDCFGVYGVARELHAVTGAELAPRAVGRRRRGDRRGRASSDYASVTRRGPRALPALHRPRVHRRRDRPLAAVAEGAADRGRAAADQQRRRHHQLRDADDRAAAARLRPRQGARAARSSSARRARARR